MAKINIIESKGGSGVFVQVPELRSEQAVIVDYKEFDQVEVKYNDATKIVDQIQFVYQLSTEIERADVFAAFALAGKDVTEEILTDRVGKRFTIYGKKMTRNVKLPSQINAKNKAYELNGYLDDVIGKQTDETIREFDPDDVIGVNVLLDVEHNERGENTFANVKNVKALPKKVAGIATTPIEAAGYVRLKDRPARDEQ